MFGLVPKRFCDSEVGNIDPKLIGGGFVGVCRLELISVAVNADSNGRSPWGGIDEAKLVVCGPSIVNPNFGSLGRPPFLKATQTREEGFLAPVAVAMRTQLFQPMSVLDGDDDRWPGAGRLAIARRQA